MAKTKVRAASVTGFYASIEDDRPPCAAYDERVTAMTGYDPWRSAAATEGIS